MKRIIFSLLLSLLLLVPVISLAGCGEKSRKTAEIYLLDEKNSSSPLIKELANKYKEEKGVSVKVVSSEKDKYEGTLKTEIAKTVPPAVFFIDGVSGYNAWKSYCSDLKGTALYSSLTDKSLAVKEDDGVYAIPFDVEGYGIVYNKAITDKYFSLSDRKLKEKSMDEIKSFDKLKALAEDMTANKEKLDISGVFASIPFTKGETKDFLSRLINLPLYYEADDEAPEDDPVNYLLKAKELKNGYAENIHNVFDLYVKNSAGKPDMLDSITEADSVKEFAQGKAAMILSGTDAWNKISGMGGNTVKKEDLRLMPLYIGADGESGQGICIGAERYIAINKNLSDADRRSAIDFVEWVFSSDTGKKYVSEKLGFNVPFGNFDENQLSDDPLSAEMRRYLSDSSVKNIPLVYKSRLDDAFTDAVTMALSDYAKGKNTWNDVKKTVSDKWKEMTDK